MAIHYSHLNITITDDCGNRPPVVIPANSTQADVEAAAAQYAVPAPDWVGFAGWLYQFPAIAVAMTSARASTDPQGEPATTGLPAALLEARAGNLQTWVGTWGQFLLASQLDPAAVIEIVGTAQACHLPADFVASLTPVQPPA